MKWSAVIFDMDGLMIDSEAIALEVWNDLAGEYGRVVSKELYSQVIGETPQYGARHLRAALDLPFSEEDLLQEYWTRRTDYMCRKVDPAEGLLELLDLLRASDVSMAVASNSPCDYVTAILHALNLDGFFVCVLSSEDVPRGKPAPDVYLAALDCLGVDPGHALVLEDSPAGLAAAKAAGSTCFVVPNNDISGADFSNADRVFDSLSAVVEELKPG